MTDNLPSGNNPPKNLSESEVKQLVHQILSSAERIANVGKLREALLVMNEGLVSVPNSRLLKEGREKIFLKLQDFLLETVNEHIATGTNEGKLNAFISLVDLIELEDVVGIPLDDRRRSIYELKKFNLGNFEHMIDEIVQQSYIFSVAQYDVEISLNVLDQFVSRLQTLIKITPLFPGQFFESNKRLEKRTNELKVMQQKLREIQSFLDEVNRSELWSDAINQGSFDMLEMKRMAITTQDLPDLAFIPDVKKFDQKMYESKQAYVHIESQVALIKQAFETSEDFNQVTALLRQLSPSSIKFQILSLAEYVHILDQMDYLFRVSNVFGSKPLVGRNEIEVEALRRNEQFDAWRSWENAYKAKMDEVKQFVQVVNGYELGEKNYPIRTQRRDWENVLIASREVLDILAYPPTPLHENILSRKVIEIFENSKTQIDLAAEWKHSAEQVLKSLDHVLQSQGFPSPEEFNGAVVRNDLHSLKKLIVEAEQVGALNEDQKKRLTAYKNTYQRMFQEIQKPKDLRDFYGEGGTIPVDKNKIEREQVDKVINENSKHESKDIAGRETMEKAAEEKVQLPKKFRISVSYPKLLSKRYESSFLLHIYLPEERSQVTRNIRSEFREQKANEYLQPSLIKLEQKIRIKLFSPVFDFPESVTKLIDNPVNKVTFLGMPKDNCEPGLHKVLVSISDASTDQEFESFTVNVKVVDFSFDHISRPLVSRASAVILGVGSFAMFILTFLEQIDKTVGLTSGTAAGVLALGIYVSFYNLYQRVRLNVP